MRLIHRVLAVLALLVAVLATGATSAQAARAPIYQGGSDDIVMIRTSTKPGLARITYQGEGYFSVWALKPGGDEHDLLVSTTETYSGVTAYNTGGGDKTAGFSVSADAPWKIELLPMSKAKYWAITSKGKGDQVLRLTKTSRGFHTLKIRYTGHGYFSVWTLNALGKTDDLLVSETDPYFGKVRLPAGTRYAVIKADAPWTMVRR